MLHDIGTVLSSVTLWFDDKGKIVIDLRTDISDSEAMRVDIIDILTEKVATSVEATVDHLTHLGVTL
jgi:hypothetical protein